MGQRVALHHRTEYRFDRSVRLGPHLVRLRPTPHVARAPLAYSLAVTPSHHFCSWQHDAFGNWEARLTFPEPSELLVLDVDLVVDLTVVDPFDFVLDPEMERWPFRYEPDRAKDLAPYLDVTEAGLAVETLAGSLEAGPTVEVLVELNRRLTAEITQEVRLEPGVQTPGVTLARGAGSCRDSAWLLVQVLRRAGMAARFVSGYLVDLTPDAPIDLHAWAEVYLLGAGWIGLDPTTGLLAGERHIPLAAAPRPADAAPVVGSTDPCVVELRYFHTLERLDDPPRPSQPFTAAQWEALDAVAGEVDAALATGDVRLTMGGEPTFVAPDALAAPEWRILADGPGKRARAPVLARDLLGRFARGGVVHLCDGKWYPGEDAPRWQLELVWRLDGVALWRDPDRLADHWGEGHATADHAAVFIEALAALLDVPADLLVRVPDATVLPLRWSWAKGVWETARWPTDKLELLPGDAPAGLRLPLDRLQPPDWEEPVDYPPDPFAAPPVLPDPEHPPGVRVVSFVRTALVAEARGGVVHVFIPPLPADGWMTLIPLVERAADKVALRVAVEGYSPPLDPRLGRCSITPDPGVLEVNVPPARTWPELVDIHTAVDNAARSQGLSTERFLFDGRPTGSGGGHHVTLGGPTPADSPLLRRPALLRSLLTYWQHHPALSYLFSGLFVGPTSQAPRVDEARHDSLYELEIAFSRLDAGPDRQAPPWLVDRLFRNLLVDLTGNTHRTEFCVDKLFSPDSPTGRLGLLELRAFETQPHVQMNLLQMLLVRALVARCWTDPYHHRLVRWGTALHDRFLLPHHLWADLRVVLDDLAGHGFLFEIEWFGAHLEHRCPRLGSVEEDGVTLELRTALEPWPVLGEEPGPEARTSRPVDSSLERLQVRVTGLDKDRHVLICNGRRVPLQPTGTTGEAVAGVRFRARALPASLHPTIGVQAPLVFDLIDAWSHRALVGCAYHVVHPGGRNFDVPPVNASEAEARRARRFFAHRSPGVRPVPRPEQNPDFPATLDLRRAL